MPKRTRKQQAVYDVLVEAKNPVWVWVVHWATGRTDSSARHLLNALVRRGDVRRLPGRPARYEAIR